MATKIISPSDLFRSESHQKVTYKKKLAWSTEQCSFDLSWADSIKIFNLHSNIGMIDAELTA